jgi:hypothetical protein
MWKSDQSSPHRRSYHFIYSDICAPLSSRHELGRMIGVEWSLSQPFDCSGAPPPPRVHSSLRRFSHSPRSSLSRISKSIFHRPLPRMEFVFAFHMTRLVVAVVAAIESVHQSVVEPIYCFRALAPRPPRHTGGSVGCLFGLLLGIFRKMRHGVRRSCGFSYSHTHTHTHTHLSRR